MKFLICGLGSIGQRHYKNLKTLGIKQIFVYRTGKGANKNFVAEFEKEFHPILFFNLSQALSQKPDAVIIANPTSLHIATALRAAKNGAHLLIEKPLSPDLKGLKQLVSRVKNKKLTVCVGYNFRFHPLLTKMKEMADKGRIGKIISANAQMGEYLPGWHSWEDYKKTYAARKDLSGGVILTQSHDIDYLYWFFGMPKYVAAFGNKKSNLKISVEELAQIIFEFKSGILASLHMDYLKCPAKREFEILGTKGRLVWQYEEKKLSLIPFGKNAKSLVIKEPKNFERNKMFLAELKNFIKCIKTKKQPIVDLAQGKDVLQIILAIKKSIKTKKIIKL